MVSPPTVDAMADANSAVTTDPATGETNIDASSENNITIDIGMEIPNPVEAHEEKEETVTKDPVTTTTTTFTMETTTYPTVPG